MRSVAWHHSGDDGFLATIVGRNDRSPDTSNMLSVEGDTAQGRKCLLLITLLAEGLANSIVDDKEY